MSDPADSCCEQSTPNEQPALLSIEDLVVDFDLGKAGMLRAVDSVGFSVPARGTVALVGESGSGKSVISQAIMRILPASARIRRGRIVFRDPQAGAGGELDIAAVGADSRAMRDLRGSRISMIFQEPMTSLSPLHTIGNQIAEAARLHQRVDRPAAMELAAHMLDRVGVPNAGQTVHRYPFELSGGLRQRAMIAMALVCKPALLIADEPTTALDVTIQAQILELLGSLQAELGMAILLITHDLGVVANLADEVVVVYQGRLMERGSVADVFTRPGHAYLQALMRAVPRVGLARGERLTPIREVQRSGGGYLSGGTDAGPRAESTVEVAPAARPGGLVTATPAILELEGICKTFTGRRAAGSMEPSPPALSDVSLSIRTGECLGLVGESGCGKTTLSKVILRVVRPDSGRITYLDAPAANGHAGARARDVLALGAAELFEYRRQVQYIFQDPFGSLNPRMTVFDIIAEPLLIHGIGRPEERREIVTELLGQVGMNSTHLPRYPHSFSGGQRQRIGIARALALRPRLLICDEPVSALDVSVQAQVLNLLQELKQELGLTYLFVSHNLAVVDYMADRIAVMCQGCIVEMNTRERLFATPLHPYTKALLAAVPQVSLEHRLDLGALMAGKVSDPRSWPAPFGPGGDGELPGLIEVEAGHLVRAEGSLQGSPTRRGE